MSILRKSNSSMSSRRQININGVQDNVLMLPDNEYRLVCSTSSINFELMSEAEQDALIDTYQSFLNSLPCPIQILFRVREIDIDKYLENIDSSIKNETKSEYKKQIANYSDFIKSLVSNSKLLTRSFYIIIPCRDDDLVDFEIAKEQLQLYFDIVAKGLNKLGIKLTKLTSLEVLDLFYSFYSPTLAKTQPITSQTLKLIKNQYL
jgi:hypothetical protein